MKKKNLVLFGSLTIVTILLDVWITYYLNQWRETFWESVKDKDITQFHPLLLHFTVASLVFIFSYSCGNYFLSRLSLILREYFTHKYTVVWQSSQAKLTCDTPDQRIAVDIDLVTSESLLIASQSVTHILTVIIFGVLIWNLSAIIFSFPGLLFWITLGYCILGNLAICLWGNTLIPVDINKQQVEAEYRQSLMKSYEGYDQQHLVQQFNGIVQVALQFMKKHMYLDYITSSYNQIGIIWPLLFLVPGFYAGKFVFGVLMQIINAIETFIDSASYIINSYPTIIDLIGSYRRLKSFLKEIQ